MNRYFVARTTLATASTAAKDLMRIIPSTVTSDYIYIHEARVNFACTVSEKVAICLGIGKGLGGTNALTTIAAVPLNCNSSIFSKANAYGKATTNTTNVASLDYQIVDKRNNYLFQPWVGHFSPRINPGDKLVLRIDSTHADDYAVSAQIIFSESIR